MDAVHGVAVIPAYQPDPVLLELLEELVETGFSCVVVDDGSGTAYAGLFRQAARRAVVLTHRTNRGKGRALKTALAYLKDKAPGSTVVTLDADGQHRPADAAAVREAAQRSPEALVLGSRVLTDRAPLRSRAGNGVTRWAYQLSTGRSVRDTQTGLRGFSAGLIPRLLEIPGERYEYEMNVLLAFALERRPIVEVTISTIYIDRNRGSHFDPVGDSWRICRELLKFSGSSLVSFGVDYGLFALLSTLTAGSGPAGLVLSNVGARVISASVNYTLNRKLVFHSGAGVKRTAGQYAALAGAILAGNTMVLHLLADRAGLNRCGAKLATELLCFTVSWTVQRRVIFRWRAGTAPSREVPGHE